MDEEEEEVFQQQPDQIIKVGHHAVPWWLKVAYILLPIWGVIAMYVYWNGERGDWLDRGRWQALQEAAKTR